MSQDKNNATQDKTQDGDFTGNISRTLSDAMVTSMAECFAIQQGVMNIPTFNGKNMPVRDFIQVVLNGEPSVPANCEGQYTMAVLARLKVAARDSTHGKSFFTITDLIQHLKQRFSSKKLTRGTCKRSPRFECLAAKMYVSFTTESPYQNPEPKRR